VCRHHLADRDHLGLTFFDDFEDDLAIGAGGGGIQNRANRLRGASLLPMTRPRSFLCDLQLEDGGGLTLGLLHLDRLGVIDQVLGEKNEPVSFMAVPAPRVGHDQAVGEAGAVLRMSCATVWVGWAPFFNHAASFSAWNWKLGWESGWGRKCRLDR